MNGFELVFIVSFLTALVVLVTVSVSAIRGKKAQALARLRNLLICAVAYMTVVVAVASFSPRKTYRIGESQCFDDWCIAVVGAVRPQPATVNVALQLSSRARRVPQGEKGTVVYLVDSLGRRYDPMPDSAAVPFDTLLQPGESVSAPRRFSVKEDASGLYLVYTHEGGFPIGAFIIGENEWLHGPPAVTLDL